MTYVVEMTGYNPVIEVLTAVIKHREPTNGSSQKAADISLNRHMAWNDAVAEVLAAFATSERLTRVPDLGDAREKYCPAVDTYTVRKLLERIVANWRDGMYESKTDEDWRRDVTVLWDEMVMPEEMIYDWERRRRAAIRTGKIPPHQDDVEWLEEELRDMRKSTLPIEDMLRQARGEEPLPRCITCGGAGRQDEGNNCDRCAGTGIDPETRD